MMDGHDNIRFPEPGFELIHHEVAVNLFQVVDGEGVRARTDRRKSYRWFTQPKLSGKHATTTACDQGKKSSRSFSSVAHRRSAVFRGRATLGPGDLDPSRTLAKLFLRNAIRCQS